MDKHIKQITNDETNMTRKILMESFKYKKQSIQYTSVKSFIKSSKHLNDQNNKMRENIIGAIINQQVPKKYYQGSDGFSKIWTHLRAKVEDYVQTIMKDVSPEEEMKTVKCEHKGGRKFNFDFHIIVNDVYTFNIELKFNAQKIDDAPQFVSPMKPSQYLSNSFEEYHYETCVPEFCQMGQCPIPSKEEYLKQIHSTQPSCVRELQQKYYQGCKQSSKFSEKKEDIDFYNTCKDQSKQCIASFIEKTDLKIDELSSYLKQSQNEKVYMLWSGDGFQNEKANLDDYELISYIKDPKRSRYVATSKSGKKN